MLNKNGCTLAASASIVVAEGRGLLFASVDTCCLRHALAAATPTKHTFTCRDYTQKYDINIIYLI